MRRLLAVILVAVSFAVLAPAAPVPKHLMKNRPVYYFPVTPGATWVYEGNTYVVEKVENEKGAKIVSVVSVSDGRKTPGEVMQVSETGLMRLSTGGPLFDVPLPMLQGPFRVGTTWEIKTSGAQGQAKIISLEPIKVPAGTFEAVCVELEQSPGGRPRTIRAWYAPGVGLLKMTENDREIWLLQAFTPGKE